MRKGIIADSSRQRSSEGHFSLYTLECKHSRRVGQQQFSMDIQKPFLFLVLLFCARIYDCEGQPPSEDSPGDDDTKFCDNPSNKCGNGVGAENENKEIIPAEKLVDALSHIQWRSFLLSEDELNQVENMLQANKDELGLALGADTDPCCTTDYTGAPERWCGVRRAADMTEYVIICPEVDGTKYYQFAHIGRCASPGGECGCQHGRHCRQKHRLASFWACPVNGCKRETALFRLFHVPAYCTCE